MTQISGNLVRARKDAEKWNSDVAKETALSLDVAGESRIDWDADAGESWIRVISGERVVAYVSAVLPLVIAERRLSGRIAGEDVMQLVLVDDMDESELFATRESVQTAFGDTRRLDHINLNGFSAGDLWYATV